MNLYRVFLISFLFISTIMIGQNKWTLSGIVIDEQSKTPIEFATVVVKSITDNKIVEGGSTNQNGEFLIHTNTDKIKIEISFIGFETKIIKNLKIKNNKSDLGPISLKTDNNLLANINLETEASQTTFKVDKRVFNVGTDLTSQGASALEVLNNVPSVEVNIEGQVSLRGNSGVQMLINGKPSVILSNGGNALGTLTADMIEKVEVITNPSAKYDAEGTSGIINIVLKKEEKKGVNGSITLNTGYPNNHSIGFSLNKRTEKFNLFSQFGIGYRTFKRENDSKNQDFNQNSILEKDGQSDKNENFYNMVLGTDYHINERNILTLSGNLAFEKESEEATNIYSLNSTTAPLNRWNRAENTSATNPKWQYELQYKKDFKRHKDQQLLFSALGSYFGKEKESDFINTRIEGDNLNGFQTSNTNFNELSNTYKLDYTHPLKKVFVIETGVQYVTSDVSNDYEVADVINDIKTIDQNFTNIFDFDQKVLGTYFTGSFEGTRWGIKTGLRLENTQLNTELKNNNQKKDVNYTDLFPSFHSSFKANERLSFQFGYSRRIFRPQLWNLNPFFSFRDNFNISTGNPDLNAEYTNSVETTGIFIAKKYTLNFSVYNRFTTSVIENIRTFENNITTSQPENIGTNSTTGLELNLKANASKKVVLLADFNLSYFNRKGEFETQNFDFNGSRWNSKLTLKYKLPKDFDIEITNNIRSKFKTVQGIQKATYFVNFGARKKILKGKVVVNISVRDLFATRKRETEFINENYNLYSLSQRGRTITVGVSYGFGKGEAMEFSGHKRF